MKVRCLSLALLALAAVQATASFVPVQYYNDNYYVYTYSGPTDRIYPGTYPLGASCHTYYHLCQASDGYGTGTAFGDGFLTESHLGMQVSCHVTGRASVAGGSEYRFQVNETVNATFSTNGTFLSVVWWDLNYVRLANLSTGQTIYSNQYLNAPYTQAVTLVPNNTYSLYVSGNRNNLYQGGIADNTNFLGADLVLNGTIVGFAELMDTTIPKDRVPMNIAIVQNGIEVDTLRTSMTHTGRFSAHTAIRGEAEVAVKPDFFLSRRSTQTLADAPVYLPYMTFINGDIDNDNEVGPNDFSRLSSGFGTTAGDPYWDAPADLDYDGEVGPSDFSILSQNFGLVGE